MIFTQIFGQEEREPIFPRVHKNVFILHYHDLKLEYLYAFGNTDFKQKTSFSFGYNLERKFNGEEFRLITGLEYQYRNLTTSLNNILIDYQYHGFSIPSYIRVVYHSRQEYWLDLGINNYIIFDANKFDNSSQIKTDLKKIYQPYFHLAFTVQVHYKTFLKLSYNKDLIETDELNWKYQNVGLSVLYRL